jgi:histidine triad (HIT) family protein
MLFAQIVASGLKKAISCQRIGISVIGLEIPHAHIHLIPMNSIDDMNFSRPKLSFTNEELEATAEKIKEQL